MRSGTATSCIACGRPDGATPVGNEIAGKPAVLHGAQSEASPVHVRPRGGKAGAVGPSSASYDSSTRCASSRKRRRTRSARTYAAAGRVSPISTSERMPSPYSAACLPKLAS